jgi:alpha-tubulin suppressor-like RCC1 family protein
MSTGSCGTSCTACPAPTGGTATCDGTSCGLTCGSSLPKKCAASSLCIASTGCCASSECTGAGTSCGGTCNISNACVYPTSSCGSGPTCSGTSFVGQGSCNNGSCATPTATTCSSHLNCGTAGNCLLSCSQDSDCVSGYYCAGATCHLTAVSLGNGDATFCALLADATIHCWGYNLYGELGQGNFTNNPAPPQPAVSLPKGAVQIAMQADTAYALLTDGSVWAWGENNKGQLGQGNFTTTGNMGSDTPVQVTGLPGPATAVFSGYWHACAIVSGDAWCWGENQYGELGNGTYTTTAPTGIAAAAKVPGLGTVTTMALGLNHTCAMSSGTLKCWGNNNYGQLGIGNFTTFQSATPLTVMLGASPPSITAISASYYSSCLLYSTGVVNCWGYDNYGDLGNGMTPPSSYPQGLPTPGPISGTQVASSFSMGYDDSCLINGSGAIWCWGRNDLGQLGIGTETTGSPAGSIVPVAVTGLPLPATNVYGSRSATCAILNDGALWCWGSTNDPNNPTKLEAVTQW